MVIIDVMKMDIIVDGVFSIKLMLVVKKINYLHGVNMVVIIILI